MQKLYGFVLRNVKFLTCKGCCERDFSLPLHFYQGKARSDGAIMKKTSHAHRYQTVRCVLAFAVDV